MRAIVFVRDAGEDFLVAEASLGDTLRTGGG